MPQFNRIQNPIIQDRVHELLGIKGTGSASPTLGGEVHPVVIVGDVSEESGRQRVRRWALARTVVTSAVGTQFCRATMINPAGTRTRVKIKRVYVAAEGNVAVGCGFLDSDNFAQGFAAAQETHRESAAVDLGARFSVAASAAIVAVNVITLQLTTGDQITEFNFEDLVLQPGQAFCCTSFSALTVGTNFRTNWEWREDAF